MNIDHQDFRNEIDANQKKYEKLIDEETFFAVGGIFLEDFWLQLLKSKKINIPFFFSHPPPPKNKKKK